MPTGEVAAEPRRAYDIRNPTIGALALAALLVWIAATAVKPLNDNSFFTHLATGRIILDEGSVPTADPYSWSAPGEDWVVQSWLASVVYGAVEKLGGIDLLRAFMGVQVAALGLLVWRLSRPAEGLLPRMVVVVLPLAVGTVGWSERPLLIGLLCAGAVLLAADQQLRPWWLVPIGWVWVNTHGSFPLGVVVLGALAAGSWLDGTRPVPELRPLVALLIGIAAGAVNPLGPVLLLFPINLLANSDALSNVSEWQAPGFRDLWERAFLAQMALGWLSLVRRPSWRSGLLVVVASVLALIALRNIMLASLALVPITARAFGDLGSIKCSTRLRLGMPVGAALVALAAIVAVAGLADPAVAYGRYPVSALAWLRTAPAVEVDEGTRVVTEDSTGNLLTAIDGDDASVFYDDRFDMYPDEVTEDYLELFGASPEALSVLDQRDVDVVVWRRDRPLPRVMLGSPVWRTLYSDEGWVVLCRRAALGERCPVEAS
jgi:hypothetical protein